MSPQRSGTTLRLKCRTKQVSGKAAQPLAWGGLAATGAALAALESSSASSTSEAAAGQIMPGSDTDSRG